MWCGAAKASNCTPYSFNLTNGQPADATQVMSNFNNVLNCANINLAHNAANSDITSLSGLTGAIGNPTSIVFSNATSGTLTITPPTGALGAVTATIPDNTGTVMESNLTATVSAVFGFPNGDLCLSNGGFCNLLETSGLAAGHVITFPALTSTAALLAATQTWTGGNTFNSNTTFGGATTVTMPDGTNDSSTGWSSLVTTGTVTATGAFVAKSNGVEYAFNTSASGIGLGWNGGTQIVLATGLGAGSNALDFGISTASTWTLDGGLTLTNLKTGTATKYLCVTAGNVVVAQVAAC